jgi:large subunit ribosomal protein L6
MTASIEKTLKFPEKIQATLGKNNSVTITGPKGSLTKEFKTHRVKIEVKGNKIILEGKPKNKQTDVFVETIISHIKNMAEGVLLGYKYELKVMYSHFPMSMQVEKEFVSIKNFLGEKYPRKSRIIGETKVEVKGQDIIIKGINKEEVGQTASNLELKTKVKNKDIRRYQDGIYLVQKGNMEKSEGKIVEVIRGRE